jgi:hypothetical protein
MSWRIVPTIAVAAAIVVAALAVVGSSHHSALDPVANAAEATARAGSVEFGMAGNVSTGGQTIPLSGSGAMDMRNLRSHMSMSTSLPGLGQTTIDEIMNGTTIYMHMPQLASKLPGGKSWMKIDLQAFGKASGVDFAKAMQQNSAQQNPADMLSYLKAVGSSRVVGHEAIRGSDTTHYSATIDIAKATSRLDKQTGEDLKRLEASAGLTRIPVDVWVDRSGLVRREHLAMSISPPGQAAASMDFTLEFLRFGVPVDATPPPADQVIDFSSLLGTSGSGG